MIPEENSQNHELVIFLTFVVLIAVGTVALKSPLVHHSHGVSFLDALFIATSNSQEYQQQG